MLAAPVLAGDAHAALDFVEDEQHVVLVANPAQRLQEFAPEMVVAALALDRLDDDRGDVRGLLGEHVADLLECQLFLLDDRRLALGGRQGEVQARARRCAARGTWRSRAILRGSVFVRLIV